ncbi:MAG: hypothetical protein ABR588_06185 [Sphingomicrobium sp.]
MADHLENEELARAVASADILFNPSMTEAFGKCRARSNGVRPCGRQRRHAQRSIIGGDGRAGILSANSVDCCAASITSLISSRERRLLLGKAASEAYSWDAASRSVERTYHNVLKGPVCAS